MFPGTRADVDKDAIIEAMGAEGYFFATMVYLVDDPNHNFGLLPECSGMYCHLPTYTHNILHALCVMSNSTLPTTIRFRSCCKWILC